MRFAVLLVLLATILLPASVPAQSPTEVIFILDASGSMWGQIEGEAKIVIARKVLRQLIQALPDETQVGLIAYGHRRKGDCSDVETLVPLGPLDKGNLIATIDGLNPKGKTPITISAKAALDLVQDRDEPVSIILISDGIETCDADPCEAVRIAKTSGIPFVMHVVGFDVGDSDTAQLECTAQAGGGLYLGAGRAEELLAALQQAVDTPAEPAGVLSVGALHNGKLLDATVRVFPPGSSEEVANERTYAREATNPRLFYVPDGEYTIVVTPLGLDGVAPVTFEGVKIAEPQVTKRIAEFGSSDLAVGATRNGALSDAVVSVFVAGTQDRVAGGRTYTRESSNPLLMKVPAGDYDIEVAPLEVESAEPARFENVTVGGSERTERTADFSSGELAVKVIRQGELFDATIHVTAAGSTGSVAQGRSYTGESSNPWVATVPPGSYDVVVKPLKLHGVEPGRVEDITVVANERVDHVVEFVTGTLKIGATKDGELVDAVVKVLRDGKSVVGRRTYESASSNPISFDVAPGTYDVTVRPLRVEGAEEQTFTLSVDAQGIAEKIVQF